MPQNSLNTNKVALITGSAQRIGAAIATYLHANGWRVVIHYYTSKAAAESLVAQLNQQRADSAWAIAADLNNANTTHGVIEKIVHHWQRLDALINNASVFKPTPVADVTLKQWQELFTINVEAPFFLSQAAIPYLKQTQGNIINITDTHANGRPMKNYSVYCMSKAGLLMQTQALARELAPDIRVNAVAPGVSMWEGELSAKQQEILKRTPLKRAGLADEIAKAVYYLLTDATYTTVNVLYVDGGRLLFN